MIFQWTLDKTKSSLPLVEKKMKSTKSTGMPFLKKGKWGMKGEISTLTNYPL